MYEDSNFGPLRPERSALTRLSYTPKNWQMRLDLNQCAPPYEGGALPLSYASVEISFRQHSQRPVTLMAFPAWHAALRSLLFKSNTNTFRPGSRNPRDGLFANTDEMKLEVVASCTFRLALIDKRERQRMTSNC